MGKMKEAAIEERQKMRDEYKRILSEIIVDVEDYKKIAALISSDINQWFDIDENNEKLSEVWVAINAAVYKRYAVVNDAYRDWFAEELQNDESLPHWDTWSISLNEEAELKLKEEQELKDFAVMNDLLANARPRDPWKEERQLKAKKARRAKSKVASKARKLSK